MHKDAETDNKDGLPFKLERIIC